MMNKGRAKCDRLKKIRKALADRLHVDLHQTECTFAGNCRGTCPKCKQEEEILNRELLKRAAGLGVGTLAGFSLAGCSPSDIGLVNETTGALPPPIEEEVTTGEAPYEETTGAPLEEWFEEETYEEPAADDAPQAGGEEEAPSDGTACK